MSICDHCTTGRLTPPARLLAALPILFVKTHQDLKPDFLAVTEHYLFPRPTQPWLAKKSSNQGCTQGFQVG